MSENQNNSPVRMQIDNYAMGENSSNTVNNYPYPPRQNEQDREIYNQETAYLPLPNQIKEALTTIRKFLSRQESRHEIKINKDTIFINGKEIELEYEACKICKLQPSSLVCSECERKVCPKCVVKRSKKTKCFRCKNAQKTKGKINSEFEDKIENLLSLEKNDKIRDLILVEVENLEGKSLEELIEVVRKLRKKGDKLNRETSIAYFYVGKIFYEKIEMSFKEENLIEEQKNRKILGSFKYAKDLDFGKEKMSIREIKEKLEISDTNLSRFFNLTLKIFLTYKNFEEPEIQIRRAEHIPSANWLRDLSQDKFLDFLDKLEKEIKERNDI
ncbi:MAG: hypothetical protein I3273_05805 [Candidatus Moeniiplasma glomeromycotorum]|nr:hypothetical protein [Candidatus Moeniiplasma glomeromycotorum]MCE8169600.1 hypothetical protein [Candidatus Moeniiplasma glomeromycotorum]